MNKLKPNKHFLTITIENQTMVLIKNCKFNDSEYNNYFENYSYELSDFQKHAIKAIVDGDHVLITAHTGSGKTLPAEFAIQHLVTAGKKIIYTSPIKALSNQKYYEFSKKYPHISFGLLTGDIKTNPEADVLIMTTEILMNRLFDTDKKKHAHLSFDMNIQEDLGAVIFDECHYINDKHRGQVWEQTIMMLPAHIQMVMLSATIDNPERFANWCESVKDVNHNRKSVVICSTNHRVVPLTHYVFLSSVEGLFKKMKDKDAEANVRKSLNRCLTIQDADGNFKTDTYNTVSNITKMMEKHNVYHNRKYVLNELIGHLHKESMLPAIVFVFSRKLVEQCAEEVQVNLLDDNEIVPYQIQKECDDALRKLPNWREYADLPEYHTLISLLEKGIGIHHSGMMPVLREIVELMISKKYIKVLFATESFAIGLDCPIKTAVFINLKKHDGGESPRHLMSHEYTQMAGRAGRRGIDTIGNVIHCSNLFELPIVSIYKEILGGVPQKLTSKFQIYYPVVLNLLSDLKKFMNKSMLSSEMESMERGLKDQIAELENDLLKKSNGFVNLKTPIEILTEFHELQKSLEMASNKKRKEVDKKIASAIQSNPTILKDIVYFREYESLKLGVQTKINALNGTQQYIDNEVQNVISVLRKYEIVRDESLDLTEVKGSICQQIAEVNPVLMTELITTWDDFANFDSAHLAGFLSIFTDVRSHEYVNPNNCSYDTFLNDRIRNFNKLCDSLINCEEQFHIYSGENLADFSYVIVDDVLEWCECENEAQCRILLQRLNAEKGISVGDFTKATLKISIVARELISVCENMGKIDLMNRLSKIDGLILKHVSTNQSLYL
jgi:superfamily II RNA helicase